MYCIGKLSSTPNQNVPVIQIGPWYRGGVQYLYQNFKIILIKYQNFKCSCFKISEFLYHNFRIPVSKCQKSWIKYQNFRSVDQNFRGLDHGSKFQKWLDHGSEFTPSRALFLGKRTTVKYNTLNCWDIVHFYGE